MPGLVYLLAAFMITAFTVSWAVTPQVIKLKILDRPNHRKIHRSPVPKAGGIGIYLGFMAGMTAAHFLRGKLGLETSPQVIGILLAAGLTFSLGLVDDRRELPAGVKLLGQVAAALVLVGSGVAFGSGPAAWMVTVAWVVLVLNAVNLIDGLDGLAAGIAVIAAVVFLFIGAVEGQALVAVLAVCLIGGTLGFLVYNFHPARIFMGDTGSLFLGLVLSSLGILVARDSGSLEGSMVPVLVLGVPLFDTFLSILRRYIHHRPIFAADRSHFYNLLMDQWGFSHRAAVLVNYVLAAVFGMAGMAYYWGNGVLQAAIVVLVLAGSVYGVYRFDLLKVDGARVVYSKEEKMSM
ncbi:MraY family glycosyltransferase [Calderihabitans maritimus]|uniref:UDP-phosphate N-acetylglucosaminyl 1-phosphate transferase n=1 Tax=Calderihabitans maritimus TaxID=1246530 RepID=A0A1Z5HWU4_9FIRM|nr:MraY family glycosyltransferase [Calderihabitans maritimus]GAW94002.1 UDP-phosphate N-acetylglucosaminyl 1-phosphate transferase [Calderihabitans maritimus]